MNIMFSDSAKFQVGTLREENRRVVERWIGRLVGWENDHYLRWRAKRLPGSEDVHVLKAGPNYRVFFQARGDTITILDIARRETIEKFAPAQGHKPS
jgi:mRNA-degrading endonuclease RelE of RelBE toxin-antitoxin system